MRPEKRYYTLNDDHEVVQCDIREWSALYDTDEGQARRTVAQTRIGEYFVSTVFLGVDHRFGEGPPLLFETTVFDQRRSRPITELWHEQYTERYSTWAEAKEGHEFVVANVKRSSGGE